MTITRSAYLSLLAALALLICVAPPPAPVARALGAVDAPEVSPRAPSGTGVMFIENVGQWDSLASTASPPRAYTPSHSSRSTDSSTSARQRLDSSRIPRGPREWLSGHPQSLRILLKPCNRKSRSSIAPGSVSPSRGEPLIRGGL